MGEDIRLYFAPGACSLSDHIALREAGLDPELVQVDIPARRTREGEDFTRVNPKGYVPALVLGDGTVLTENAAILAWVAEQAPELAPDGALGRVRLIEMLAFIASEVHKPFIRYFFPASPADRTVAGDLLRRRLGYLADWLDGDHVFGAEVSVADAYLYVMTRWARDAPGIELPPVLAAYAQRMEARPAVRAALAREGLA